MASIFSGRAGRNAAIWTGMQAPQHAEAVRNILDDGERRALNEVGSGYGSARDQYGQAIDYYQPWASTGLNAFNTLADS